MGAEETEVMYKGFLKAVPIDRWAPWKLRPRLRHLSLRIIHEAGDAREGRKGRWGDGVREGRGRGGAAEGRQGGRQGERRKKVGRVRDGKGEGRRKADRARDGKGENDGDASEDTQARAGKGGEGRARLQKGDQ